MVAMLALMLHVGCRIKPGEGTEIVIEMSLVIITAFKYNITPIDLLASMNEVQHFLESLDTTKQFGGHSYFVAEHLYKMSLTNAKALAYIRCGSNAGQVVHFL